MHSGNDDDLEFFVREAGEVLGVTGQLDSSKRDGKHILEFIFRKVLLPRLLCLHLTAPRWWTTRRRARPDPTANCTEVLFGMRLIAKSPHDMS